MTHLCCSLQPASFTRLLACSLLRCCVCTACAHCSVARMAGCCGGTCATHWLPQALGSLPVAGTAGPPPLCSCRPAPGAAGRLPARVPPAAPALPGAALQGCWDPEPCRHAAWVNYRAGSWSRPASQGARTGALQLACMHVRRGGCPGCHARAGVHARAAQPNGLAYRASPEPNRAGSCRPCLGWLQPCAPPAPPPAHQGGRQGPGRRPGEPLQGGDEAAPPLAPLKAADAPAARRRRTGLGSGPAPAGLPAARRACAAQSRLCMGTMQKRRASRQLAVCVLPLRPALACARPPMQHTAVLPLPGRLVTLRRRPLPAQEAWLLASASRCCSLALHEATHPQSPSLCRRSSARS